MFGAIKGKRFEQLPSSEQVLSDGQIKNDHLVIGLGLKVTGDVETNARLRIDGEVHGEISATTVLVSEKARITGGITADEIVVEGELMGTVRGKRVVLRSTCRVEADIFHESLVIEDNATRNTTKRECQPADGERRDGSSQR